MSLKVPDDLATPEMQALTKSIEDLLIEARKLGVTFIVAWSHSDFQRIGYRGYPEDLNNLLNRLVEEERSSWEGT